LRGRAPHPIATQVLAKWRAPTLTTDRLEDAPVFEASLAEYVDYCLAVEAYDGGCDLRRSAAAPRCYCNGLEIRALGDVVHSPPWVADDSEALFRAWEKRVDAALRRTPPPDAEVRLGDRSLSLTKVFVAPPGAITRLRPSTSSRPPSPPALAQIELSLHGFWGPGGPWLLVVPQRPERNSPRVRTDARVEGISNRLFFL